MILDNPTQYMSDSNRSVYYAAELEEKLWRVAKECVKKIDGEGGMGQDAVEIIAKRMLKLHRIAKAKEKAQSLDTRL